MILVLVEQSSTNHQNSEQLENGIETMEDEEMEIDEEEDIENSEEAMLLAEREQRKHFNFFLNFYL